jgi:hypothetical protein
LVPEIHGYRAIPIFRSDVFDGMSGIVSRVIDKNANGPVARFNLGDGSTEFRNIRQIARQKNRRVRTSRGKLNNQLLRAFMINVQERYLRTLRSEMLDERSANPLCSPGDKDQLVSQTRIDGKAVLILLSHTVHSLVCRFGPGRLFTESHGERVYITAVDSKSDLAGTSSSLRERRAQNYPRRAGATVRGGGASVSTPRQPTGRPLTASFTERKRTTYISWR